MRLVIEQPIHTIETNVLEIVALLQFAAVDAHADTARLDVRGVRQGRQDALRRG